MFNKVWEILLRRKGSKCLFVIFLNITPLNFVNRDMKIWPFSVALRFLDGAITENDTILAQKAAVIIKPSSVIALHVFSVLMASVILYGRLLSNKKKKHNNVSSK